MFDKGERLQAKSLPAKLMLRRMLSSSCGSLLAGAKVESHPTAILIGTALVSTDSAATARHSFAMFDQANPIDLAGVVKDWKYAAPHVFIVLEVKEAEGTTQVWNLEGNAPSTLAREGWTGETSKPGDELVLKIDPLRSGAPGGAFNINKVTFKDGGPIVPSH